MRERFLGLFKRKSPEEKLSEETGYPIETTEAIMKMFRGEIPPQIIITNIDDDGQAKVETVDLPVSDGSEKE